MRMTSRLIALMAFSTALGWALSANAQFNPFLGAANTPALTSDDWGLLNDGADKLNADPRAHSGQTERWKNPRSGASGSITLTGAFRTDGMDCHALRYTIAVRSRTGTRSYNVNWCRDAAGEWKIKS